MWFAFGHDRPKLRFMMRRRLFRAWTTVLAVVQMVGPGVVSMADAATDAGALSRWPVAHVESHRTATCARVHADDCALCRYLTGSGASPERESSLAEGNLLHAVVKGSTVESLPSRRSGLPRPRGPPESVV
ncbi:MAG: hypothetical protein NVS9B3_03680 [Gemmatimonadaceae bacterium]